MRLQVVIETAAEHPGDVPASMEIGREELRSDPVGLTLAEAKTGLEKLQQAIVEQQRAEPLRTQRHCHHWGKKRYPKGDPTVTLRTLFGKLRLKSPRCYHCPCQSHPTETFSPLAELLPERSTPELR